MKVEQFLDLEGKKIILSDTVSVGNAIRRHSNIENGTKAVDVTTLNVFNIAKELVTAYEAINGTRDGFVLIDSAAAAYILDSVIAENKPSFIDEFSLTISTVQNIYSILSTIRLFSKTEEYENTQDEKINEIKKLISVFEEKLINDRTYDKPLVLKKALGILNEYKQGKSTYPIEFYLPWIKDCVVGDVETNRRTGIEEEIIRGLLEVSKVKLESIESLQFESVEDSKRSANVNWRFVKAYGNANEVRFVCDEIKKLTERKKDRVPFDKINVFYTSSDYEGFLSGYLDYNKIPYVFNDGYHAMNTGYIQLLNSILDFVESDYDFTKLNDVIQNQLITFNNKIRDIQKVNPNRAYSLTPGEKIGWGVERYRAYLEQEEVKEAIKYVEALIAKKDEKRIEEEDELIDDNSDFEADSNEEDEELEAALENEEATKDIDTETEKLINKGCFGLFLRELIAIFEEDNSLASCYERLLSFVKTYTYSKNMERNILKADLEKQVIVFSNLSSNRIQTNQDVINYIRDFLSKLTFEKKTGNVGVGVYSLNSYRFVEGEYNFFIGLSAKQFAINSIESPIMSDDEMRKYLIGNNIPFASERNGLRQEKFRRMLRGINKGEITISYSSYNTVDLRESSPSVILLELLGEDKINENIDYGIENAAFNIDVSDYFDWAKSRAVKEEKQKEKQAKKEGKPYKKFEIKRVIEKTDDAKMSASQLQDLLACPLKYYYKNIRKLKVPVVRTKQGDVWLPAMDRGNLFHRVAEKYMSQAMPPMAQITESLNEALFEKIFDEEVKAMEQEVPWTSDSIKYRETKEYKNKFKEYLATITREWWNDANDQKDWWVLGCELDFEKDDNLIYEDAGEDLYEEKAKKEKAEGDDKEQVLEEQLASEEALPEVVTKEDPTKGKAYKIHFNRGQIDRLDGYVDSEGILNLRIIDYKTGKKDNKKKEIDEGVQIQHFVYAMAAVQYIKKLRDKKVEPHVKNIFDFYDIKGVKIEEVAYVFPLEEQATAQFLSAMYSMEGLINPNEKDPFEWDIDFPNAVRWTLRKTEGYRQNGDIDKIAANVKGIIADKQVESNSCKYCDYTSVCRMKCRVDVNEDDTQE